MQSIDAIEGAVTYILENLHMQAGESGLDDTEYIGNVRAVMEAVGRFIDENREIISEPSMLHKVLYGHARNLWVSKVNESETSPDDPYSEYYFDYIYKHGTYPR
jgi:hypothetical protein